MQQTRPQATNSAGQLPDVHEERLTIAGREFVFEVGRMASLADGAVVIRYGDSVVLSTAEGEAEAREGIDFFPLTVDYEERMFAAGKIPGSFFKREGRPTEHGDSRPRGSPTARCARSSRRATATRCR